MLAAVSYPYPIVRRMVWNLSKAEYGINLQDCMESAAGSMQSAEGGIDEDEGRGRSRRFTKIACGQLQSDSLLDNFSKKPCEI